MGEHDVVLHIADVQIGELVLPGLIIVADREGYELILGRDVLNRLRLFIDGPDQVTRVQG